MAGVKWEKRMTPHETHNARESLIFEGRIRSNRVCEQFNAPEFQISSWGGSWWILLVVKSEGSRSCVQTHSRKSLASGYAHPGLPHIALHCIVTLRRRINANRLINLQTIKIERINFCEDCCLRLLNCLWCEEIEFLVLSSRETNRPRHRKTNDTSPCQDIKDFESFLLQLSNAYSDFAGGNASYGNPSQDTSFILCTEPS